jgi:hypothetical protein
MDVSSVSSLGGIAAAQMLFGATAQAAANAGPSDSASGDGSGASTSSVGVAVLRMALNVERSLVDILA